MGFGVPWGMPMHAEYLVTPTRLSRWQGNAKSSGCLAAASIAQAGACPTSLLFRRKFWFCEFDKEQAVVAIYPAVVQTANRCIRQPGK